MGVEEEIISFSSIVWVGRIIFMLLVITVIILFVNFYSDINISSHQAETELFINRMLYSPQGISYYDPISGRLYPGIIDLTKFETKTLPDSNKTLYTIPSLQKTMDFGLEKHIGAEIFITDLSDVPLKLAYYNERVYQRKEETIAGPGGVDVEYKEIYVLAKQENNLIPAILYLHVVIERSK